MTNYKPLLKNINTFVFDYDGVLTDGSIITLDDGEAYRTTNVKPFSLNSRTHASTTPAS